MGTLGYGVAAGTLALVTLLSLANALLLGWTTARVSRLRRSPWARVASAGYMTLSLGCFWVPLIAYPTLLETPAPYVCFLIAGAAYAPLYLGLHASASEVLVQFLMPRRRRDGEWERLDRVRQRLLEVVQGGDRRLLAQMLAALARRPLDPQVHRDLVELYLTLGEVERALFHNYTLVELIPNGHAHAAALYRLAQILVDRQGRLNRAQPYLRRIIRLYPKSFFASYARRLVNQFEAYADR